jgi:serine/threonine protein phosphatase PrpC
MIENKGCTANVLLVKDNTLYVANAGDSRCVLGVKGKAMPMSTDHKPNLISEKTRILKAGSTISVEGRIDGNLNLSRSIGDLKYKKNKNLKPHDHPITAFPDVKIMPINPNVDFAVIGCDGIWETKTSQ